jgi:hypothetical protein
MNERALSPWWFMLWVAGGAGVGYFTGGRLGAVEGIVAALVLAHGALLEVLSHKIEEIEILRAKLSDIRASAGGTYE